MFSEKISARWNFSLKKKPLPNKCPKTFRSRNRTIRRNTLTLLLPMRNLIHCVVCNVKQSRCASTLERLILALVSVVNTLQRLRPPSIALESISSDASHLHWIIYPTDRKSTRDFSKYCTLLHINRGRERERECLSLMHRKWPLRKERLLLTVT